MTNDSPNPTPIWRFWVPLAFQTALILAVPAQALYIHLIGKTVILQTVPMDPYEWLRGYSQMLRYDISSQDSLRKLPGWQQLPKQQPNSNRLALLQPGTRFYVILAEPASPALPNNLPQAWKPVAVSTKHPSKLPINQVAIKGLVREGFIQYGLETYYIPEDQREQINADLRAARLADPNQLQKTLPQADPNQLQQTPPVVMEIKVNAQGDAVPISLWARVGQASKPQIRNYRF
jgi:uncharacterized membrane-anchored protein